MDEICFSCSRTLNVKGRAEFYERRRTCTQRGFHEPAGPVIIHELTQTKRCKTCKTLVIPV